MESKLLVGGKSIVDKTTEQERALEQRRHEIAEQKVPKIETTSTFFFHFHINLECYS